MQECCGAEFMCCHYAPEKLERRNFRTEGVRWRRGWEQKILSQNFVCRAVWHYSRSQRLSCSMGWFSALHFNKSYILEVQNERKNESAALKRDKGYNKTVITYKCHPSHSDVSKDKREFLVSLTNSTLKTIKINWKPLANAVSIGWAQQKSLVGLSNQQIYIRIKSQMSIFLLMSRTYQTLINLYKPLNVWPDDS